MAGNPRQIAARLEDENARLRATVRRLRRRIRALYASTRPDGGPHLDGATAAVWAAEHDAELRRALR